MKKLLLLFFILSTVCAQAKYYEAKLLMADGTIKDGFAKLPSNQLLDTHIEFKTSEKGEVE